jgi:ADP-heptose:LPS heptosyltransferase
VDIHGHDIDQNMNLDAKFLDSPDVARQKRVFPELFGDEHREWAKDYLSRLGFKRIVAIHAGSSAEHGMAMKRWAPEKFGRLADKICDKLEAQAIALGGNDESDIKNAVCASMENPCHALPRISLKKTAALISMCSLAICNDSGLMHISACVKTPTIAIFGPTDPGRNGPVGDNTLVIRKHMDGFPLWTAKNVGNRAIPRGINPQASLDALGVDEAWEQVRLWLRSLV